MTAFTESTVEEAALAWLEAIGWRIAHGPDIAPDMPAAERTDCGEVVLARRMRDALPRLNPELPAEALEDAFRKLSRPEGADLIQRNRALHRPLVDGVTVEYRDAEGEIRGAQARVIDFDEPEDNDWLAVNQFTVVENKHNRRPDVVLFVNGVPLALVELKNAAVESATIWTAFQQLQTYQADIPSLFASNGVLVVSDGIEARAGTLTAGREWFKPWRTISGDAAAGAHMPELQVVIEGLPAPRRFLDLLRDFIAFEDDGGGRLSKKMAGYHQYHAVQVAVRETLRAAEPARAEEAAEALRRYEAGRKAGGVVFTTIHKFFPEEKGDRHPTLSGRGKIVVIADEAHRSQYDFIDGFARHMRDALPHASFIGFTGTPIELKDANTRAVFGDYISVYDIQRAVEDGATVRIYYESRLAKVALDEAERPRIDPDFEEVTEDEEVERKEKLKTRWAQLEAVVGSQERLSLLPNAQEHILAQENGKDRCIRAVRELSAAFALSVPHKEALRIRDDVAFFQAVQAGLVKRAPADARPEEELDHAVRQIISRAVAPEGVVDIFAAAGLDKPDISILSDEFLAEVRGMPQRNLAVELLQKLLNGEIATRRRKNAVQARSFAEMLEQTIRKYQNRAIEAAQVIEELIQLAKEMRQANARGEQLGLTEEELAFYDALETNDSAVKVLGDQILRGIAREHGYPPDKQEKATQTVLEQAALLSSEWATV